MKYLKYIISFISIVSIYLLLNNSTNMVSLKVANESNLIDLKNPSIITNDNVSIFRALLINNREKSIYINSIEVIVKDSEKNTMCTFSIVINKSIEVDQSIKLEKEVKFDLSNATSFDYIVN